MIEDETLVWGDGMEAWAPWEAAKHLFGFGEAVDDELEAGALRPPPHKALLVKLRLSL